MFYLDWKNALSEGWIVYTRDLLEFWKITLIFLICIAMGFGAPLGIALLAYFLTVGVGFPNGILVPLTIVIFSVCALAGTVIAAALKGGYYAACHETYNDGTVNPLSFIEFAQKHAPTVVAVEFVQIGIVALFAVPLGAISIMAKSGAFNAIALGILVLIAAVVSCLASLALPAVVIDGHGAAAALKKSYRTVTDNARNFAFVYLILLFFAAAFSLVPVIGYVLLAFAYLPYTTIVYTLYYRSQRRV